VARDDIGITLCKSLLNRLTMKIEATPREMINKLSEMKMTLLTIRLNFCSLVLSFIFFLMMSSKMAVEV